MQNVTAHLCEATCFSWILCFVLFLKCFSGVQLGAFIGKKYVSTIKCNIIPAAVFRKNGG